MSYDYKTVIVPSVTSSLCHLFSVSHLFSVTSSLPLGFAELSFYNVKAQQVVEPADYTVFIGGSSTTTNAGHFTTTP